MKTAVLAIFTLFLSHPAWALPLFPHVPDQTIEDDLGNGLSLRVLRYDEVLPVNGQLNCTQGKDGSVVHRLERISENEVKISLLQKGEIDPTRKPKLAVVERTNPFQDYLRSLERFGDSGFSFELVIEKRLNSATGGYVGAAMITEVTFFKDENGEEQRKLNPISMQPIVCEPIEIHP